MGDDDLSGGSPQSAYSAQPVGFAPWERSTAVPPEPVPCVLDADESGEPQSPGTPAVSPPSVALPTADDHSATPHLDATPDVPTQPATDPQSDTGTACADARLADQPMAEHTGAQPPADRPTPPDLSPAAPLDRPDSTVTPESIGAPPRSWIPTMRGRRLRIAGRTVTALTAVTALTLTGAGWNYLRATDKGFTKVQALDIGSHDIVDPIGQLGDENFLIAGTDSRAGANSQVGAGTTADAEGARSDTVMLVNIPASRQRIVVVSFPRDLDVTRPVCEGWDDDNAQYTSVKYPAALGDKLNATYALGGPKCLTKVLQKLSGLKINHFVGLDFTGFESMVDTVGGVEVCASKPIIDDQLGTVLADPGRQRINGTTALDYVRARHVVGEERSDYDRIHRQQLFLSSLLRSVLSNRVLFDPGKLDGFITAFTGHAFMDNTGTQDLLMLGRSLQNVAAGEITFLTAPTAGTTPHGNEIPRESDIKAIFRAIIDDQPLPGEQRAPDPAPAAQAPQQLTAIDPTTTSVQVTNASITSGIAGSTATKLAKQGFQIYSADTNPNGTLPTTVVRYSAGHRAEAATLAVAVPGAKLQAMTGLGSIVQVALGTDFTGAVLAPPPFGSPLPDVTSVPAEQSDQANSIPLPTDLEHVNAADDTCR